MCGLVGIYSSNMLPKHKDVLANLLYLDTWRGRDSTGVATIRHNADTEVLKATIPGYEFIEGPKLENLLRLNDFCWIGHNRFGTVGKNIKTNAHPFTVDDEDGYCMLVGAHNGTLKNKHILADHASFGTDSEALYNNIALEGLEETIAKTEGAWALTYYDHIEEELRFLRNKERTLFYALDKAKTTLFWASEMWMLRVATSRNNIDLHEDKVVACSEDTLYRFPAPSKLNQEIEIHRKGGVVGKKTEAFFQQSWTGGPKKPETQTTQKTPQQMTPSTPSGTEQKSDGEQQPLTSKSSSAESQVRDILSAKKFKGYQGALLTKKELDDQLQNGCAWCELDLIVPEDRYAWLAPSKPVCHKCLTGVEEKVTSGVLVQVATKH